MIFEKTQRSSKSQWIPSIAIIVVIHIVLGVVWQEDCLQEVNILGV
jgi:hypothetical protein